MSGAEGASKSHKRRLHVYVAEARFALDKPAASIDLSKMITRAMHEQHEPSSTPHLISPADVIPNKDPSSPNRNPKRQWCDGAATLICLESRYQLEGRLPAGILLVNKIRENHKKIADFMEFQSELRLVPEAEIDQAALAKATGIDAPIAGVRPLLLRLQSTAISSRRKKSWKAYPSCAISCPRRYSPETAHSIPEIRSAPGCRNIPAIASRQSRHCWKSEAP